MTTTTYCHDEYCEPVRKKKGTDRKNRYKMTLIEFIVVGAIFVSTLIILSCAIHAALEKLFTLLFY